MSKGKNESFGLNEAMVYVPTSWGIASDQTQCPVCPLGLFCLSPKHMTTHGQGGLEEEADIYQADLWFDFSGCVDGLSLTLF